MTDVQGKPVRGLTQSDFTIKEDGRPQPIRNFNEYGMEVPTTQSALQPLPPDIYTNQQSAAPTTSAVNVLLLDEVTTGLVDHLAMAPQNLAYARQSSTSYLKTMPPGTKVAVLLWGARLRVLQPVTTDREVLQGAIASVKYQPVPRTYLTVPSGPGEACAAANMQSQLTVDALSQAASFLSGIPGRKNLIWFTPGTPWLTNYPQFARVPCLNDYTPELQRAYAALTTAQVALYPVDPHGLKGCMPSASVAMISNSLIGTCLDALHFEHESVRDLAEATGGIAAYDRNDLDAAIGEAIATGSDYYSLAYIPPFSKYDGKYHKIEVKVDRLGLRLQYREGYTSLDPAKLLKPAEKNAVATATQPVDQFIASMGHGAMPAAQLLFTVRAKPSTTPAKPSDPAVMGNLNPALKGKPLVRYDIAYSLAADQIAFSEEANGLRKASLRFDVVAYAEDGKLLNVFSQTANLVLKPEQMQPFTARPFQFTQQFDLPPGKLFLRLGALDVPSGKYGTLEIPELVSKP